MEEGERRSAAAGSTDPQSRAGADTPAVPQPGAGTDTEPGDDEAAKIDVCSDRFDPLAALYAPTVSVPFPNVRCFNNVAEYEGFLRGGKGRAKPETLERRQRKARKGVPDPERIERLKNLMIRNPVAEEGQSSATPRRRKQKPQKNILTRMPLSKGSPLGELYRCVEERIRVKVHIRTFKGLRGMCSGFVVAFDKFWNMAMVDVDETYREPLLGEALYHEKALTITRLFEKLKVQESSEEADQGKANKACVPAGAGEPGWTESAPSEGGKKPPEKKEKHRYGKIHTRHVSQLFIRGENILLVNPQPLTGN